VNDVNLKKDSMTCSKDFFVNDVCLKNMFNLYNNCVVAKLGTASTGNFLSGKLKHQTS
jgi:hypothetical protein